ncbi:MAG: cobalamin biosynthesis protein CobD [Planctomyces sp.]|nr:cobalamin biosynthesis protein CobD [Planctomyces sp.]
MPWSLSPDLGVLLVAVVLEMVGREPPKWFHPTVWIGRSVTIAEAKAPKSRNAGFIAGVMILLLVAGIWGAAAHFAAEGLRDIHQIAYILVGGCILKTTFSVKMLHHAATKVRDLLVSGDTAGFRAQMSWLVSRDASQMTPDQAAAATVESVSENIADSIIGPWLAFALFGLPGAVAYRAINTLDSMIGYHGRYEYLGKASAKLDDLVNLIPSRLAGFLLVLASLVLPGQKASSAWRRMWRDHGKTESPNAGWTMSGMAGALGVELEKTDHYRLGDSTRQVEPEDITRTVRSMYFVAGTGLLAALGITYLRSWIW